MVKPFPQRPEKSLRVWPLTIAAAAGIIAALLTWEDVVRQRPDGGYELSEEWEAKRQEEKEHIEDCETYLLVALADGWYTCYLCPEGRYYLKMGETWKIGHTCYRPRYRKSFLEKEKVRYFIVKQGDKKVCRALEIDLITAFPLSEQNMKRPKSERLVVPPGHKRQNLK